MIQLDAMMITIGSPDVINGKEGRRVLAAFYSTLLGMQIIREDWLKIARDPGSAFQLVLDEDGWSDQRPPHWPDPEYPQQMHLDIRVPDVQAAGALVAQMGARLLRDDAEHRTYADPAGHPFCLYPAPSAGDDSGPGAVARIVFDCFSPRSLASFYEDFLGTHERVEDSPERVVITLGDERYPDLAFQHAVFVSARWPDPAYPAQLHIDYRFDDGEAACQRAAELGAIRLPKLADTDIFADPAGHPFCI